MPLKDKMPFVVPVRPSNLLWVPVAGLAWAATILWGTPHLRVGYSWNGRAAAPFYQACEYWGVSSFRVRPVDGKCPLVILAHSAPER